MSIVGDPTEKTNYFDHDDILKGWGFDCNTCFYCGIKNSDLSGLLMQCGKCKKAYYCGMKCFNLDLPKHQQFCTTQQIASEPKKSDFSIPDPTIKQLATDVKNIKVLIDDPPLAKEKNSKQGTSATKVKKSKEKKNKDETKKKKIKSAGKPKAEIKNLYEDDSSYEEYEESYVTVEQSVEVHRDASSRKGSVDEGSVEVHRDASLRKASVDEGSMNSPGNSSFQLREDAEGRQYNIQGKLGEMPPNTPFEAETVTLRPVGDRTPPPKSKSAEFHIDLKRAPERVAPPRSSSELERVDLHHSLTQMGKDYDWERPDWVNAELRPTEIGELIKTVGDIKDPSLNSSFTEREGNVWVKPEWTQKVNLKKTGAIELLQQGVDVLRTPLRTPTNNLKLRVLPLNGNLQCDLDDSSTSLTPTPGLNAGTLNSHGIDGSAKEIEWEKPKWSKTPNLRKTGILDQIKNGVDIRTATSALCNNQNTRLHSSMTNFCSDNYFLGCHMSAASIDYTHDDITEEEGEEDIENTEAVKVETDG